MLTLGAPTNLTSLARPAALSSKILGSPASANVAAIAPSPRTSNLPTLGTATPGPAPILSASAPGDRLSLGTILSLQASPLREEPQSASNQASAVYRTSDGSLNASRNQAPATQSNILGSLKETDLAGEAANLLNVADNRQTIGSPRQGLANQSPQALVKLFA